MFSDILSNARKLRFQLSRFENYHHETLSNFIDSGKQVGAERYNTHLYSETKYSALSIPQIAPKYGIEPKSINGFQILNSYFDQLLEYKPNIIAFGEDVGHIGDVNQGFAGLQNKHGHERVFDTGIREWTIMGQAMGGAMRGLRPSLGIYVCWKNLLAYYYSSIQ